MIIEFFFSLYLNIYVVVIYWRSYFESHRIKKKKIKVRRKQDFSGSLKRAHDLFEWDLSVIICVMFREPLNSVVLKTLQNWSVELVQPGARYGTGLVKTEKLSVQLWKSPDQLVKTRNRTNFWFFDRFNC